MSPGLAPRSQAPRRPQPHAAGRAAAARLDTTTSSVGPLPDRKFHPEGYELDCFAEEEGYGSDEDDQDVFAFERPITAARKMSDRVLRPPSVPQASQEDNSKDWQLVSPVNMGFSPKRSASLSGLSVKPSLVSASSYDVTTTTDGGFSTDAGNDADVVHIAKPSAKHAHRVPRCSGGDPLDASPGSRQGSTDQMTTTTLAVTELAGTTTIPDGLTTRGDGRGHLFPGRCKTETKTPHNVRCDEHEQDDSPYEEVRASVSNMDDPEMPGASLDNNSAIDPIR
ncbi:hypothetical protein QFC19_008859 [Naganishia cerealis]|uniref:Uncharacterized protein n=1 Tax=Naganishia cerealis TaxID=610337 RepID=A0ACC2UZU6_9TREE|nr:hypothetical protein QFC19_008859 [Naganishia cerealis]